MTVALTHPHLRSNTCSRCEFGSQDFSEVA